MRNKYATMALVNSRGTGSFLGVLMAMLTSKIPPDKNCYYLFIKKLSHIISVSKQNFIYHKHYIYIFKHVYLWNNY